MTGTELLLTSRLAELNDRLEELRGGDDRGFYATLAAAETDYVLPEHLPTVQDVLNAIRRAREKLNALRDTLRIVTADDVTIPGQLALDGFALPLAS